jgi:hypothetical protein
MSVPQMSVEGNVQERSSSVGVDNVNKRINKIKSDCFRAEHPDNVYIASLCPEKLLIIDVEVEGVTLRALIDSGASRNLIKHDRVTELGLKIENHDSLLIKGLGTSKFRLEGSVSGIVNMCGIEVGKTKFGVAPNNTIAVDVVLGCTFLRKHKFVIDMKRRMLELRNIDGSSNKFYFSDEGKVGKIMQENVPVYLTEKVRFKEVSTKVAVNINFQSISGILKGE